MSNIILWQLDRMRTAPANAGPRRRRRALRGPTRALVWHGQIHSLRAVSDTFGNALGNSIVGQIEATSAEKQQRLITEQNFEYDEFQRSFEPGTQSGLTPEQEASQSAIPSQGGGDTAANAQNSAAQASVINASNGEASNAPDTYTVGKGESYASIARTYYGDERLSSLILAANGVNATYGNVHSLQVGANLTLPDINSLSDDQLSAFLSGGGKLIAGDQSITDQINAARQPPPPPAAGASNGVPYYLDPNSAGRALAPIAAAATSPSDNGGFLGGVGHALYQAVYQPLATAYDLGQVAYETGRSVATGEAPRDVQYASAIGQAAAGGASSGQLLADLGKSVVLAPYNVGFGLGTALMTGNSYLAGESLANGALLFGGAKLGGADNASTGIEAQFQANSLRVANEAHDLFSQGVRDGSIPLNPKLPFNTQAGSFVDQAVRTSNLELRDQLGLDASSVRINQRLYAPNGSYTIPDIYFPESGNIIDYSYQLKTLNTPQIQGFRSASPNGTITIVPPSAIRPVYTIGP